MNSLSWFLYAADVVGNIGFIFALAAISCIGFCVICVLGQAVSEGEMSKDCPNVWWYWWRCAVYGGVLLTISALFPTKGTMYAIAASQAGEKIAQSEQVRGIADDATKALQQWIKRQIEPEAKK